VLRHSFVIGFNKQIFGKDEQVPVSATTPLKKCSALCSLQSGKGRTFDPLCLDLPRLAPLPAWLGPFPSMAATNKSLP
jgi:hypothetical protein